MMSNWDNRNSVTEYFNMKVLWGSSSTSEQEASAFKFFGALGFSVWDDFACHWLFVPLLQRPPPLWENG